MKATHIRICGLKEPMGLGNRAPSIAWFCEGGVKQTAYQIQAITDEKTIWDTGKVVSSSMRNIRYAGEALMSRQIVKVVITLWDENDIPGESAETHFEMGLLEASDWKARWITADLKVDPKKRYPVDLFRKHFSLSRPVKKARLYATARGVYEAAINGQTIRDFVLAPGMTDYRKRIQYQTYDVTSLMQEQNDIVLSLGDGWYRGSVAAYGVTNVYGKQTSVMAQLEVEYEDDTFFTLITDDSFSWCNDGPVRFSDLKDGDHVDYRKVPSFSGKAVEVEAPKAQIVASDNVYVHEKEHLPGMIHMQNAKHILYDFGQNMAGILSLQIRGEAGQKVKIVCGEILDETGHVTLKNVREEKPANGWTQLQLIKKLMNQPLGKDTTWSCKQEIGLILSGETDSFRNVFSVFGFRYAEVISDSPVTVEQMEAIALYSDMKETGSFTCSHPGVNQLVENTRWSMRSNFLDLPTDCPTRERLGWTGDAQIFFNTGAYLYDTDAFFRKWMQDMEDNQYKNGLLAAVLPYQGVDMMYKSTGSSVGWADAVYLIPYRHYLRYGDLSVLTRFWPMMKKYAEYLKKHLGMKDRKEAKANPYNAYTYEKGVHLGEWLEPEEFKDTKFGPNQKHPEECTAYLHLAMTTMAEIARLVGEDDYAANLEIYADGAKKAYDHLFVKTGTLHTNRQAKIVRPLALGLLDGEEEVAAQEDLKKAVESYDYRVGTGFLSTPFLLPELTRAGDVDVAYKLLENTQIPGWLYEVQQGATTVWEDWKGNASRNHYSPGAVCEWLFDTCAGIRVIGENRLEIHPIPGGSLTSASATYVSPYGPVKSSWEKAENGMQFTVEVPANTEAAIILPGKEPQQVTAGTYTFEESL